MRKRRKQNHEHDEILKLSLSDTHEHEPHRSWNLLSFSTVNSHQFCVFDACCTAGGSSRLFFYNENKFTNDSMEYFEPYNVCDGIQYDPNSVLIVFFLCTTIFLFAITRYKSYNIHIKYQMNRIVIFVEDGIMKGIRHKVTLGIHILQTTIN